MRIDDPEVVRREYADERRYAARMAKQQGATGPDPYAVVFDAVAERRPRDVLEVGCGRGEVAERMMQELDARVVALDQSERMVELTAARGVEAVVGDVVELPFADAGFDCAVAAWMLYHARDLDRALSELKRVLRPGGRLVAATSSERNLAEVWELVGEIGAPGGEFTVERAGRRLEGHFAHVERRVVTGTVTFPDRDAAAAYLAATRAGAEAHLPDLEGPLVATRRLAVFVCSA